MTTQPLYVAVEEGPGCGVPAGQIGLHELEDVAVVVLGVVVDGRDQLVDLLRVLGGEGIEGPFDDSAT